jgi:DNA oxidative demethylase
MKAGSARRREGSKYSSARDLFSGDLLSGDLLAGLPVQRRTYENGLVHLPAYLDDAAQRSLLSQVEAVLARSPLFQPVMPRTGRPFSVRMSNCGPLGWVSDRDSGYRYQPLHPETGMPWPPIPAVASRAWVDLISEAVQPEACLINFYDAAARMGLHQDRDETALDVPVLSLSLGCSCVFRFGSATRGGKTEAFELASGDAVLLQGPARLAYHSVARILPATSPFFESPLLTGDSRINLTLRRVTRPT